MNREEKSKTAMEKRDADSVITTIFSDGNNSSVATEVSSLSLNSLGSLQRNETPTTSKRNVRNVFRDDLKLHPSSQTFLQHVLQPNCDVGNSEGISDAFDCPKVSCVPLGHQVSDLEGSVGALAGEVPCDASLNFKPLNCMVGEGAVSRVLENVKPPQGGYQPSTGARKRRLSSLCDLVLARRLRRNALCSSPSVTAATAATADVSSGQEGDSCNKSLACEADLEGRVGASTSGVGNTAKGKNSFLFASSSKVDKPSSAVAVSPVGNVASCSVGKADDGDDEWPNFPCSPSSSSCPEADIASSSECGIVGSDEDADWPNFPFSPASSPSDVVSVSSPERFYSSESSGVGNAASLRFGNAVYSRFCNGASSRAGNNVSSRFCSVTSSRVGNAATSPIGNAASSRAGNAVSSRFCNATYLRVGNAASSRVGKGASSRVGKSAASRVGKSAAARVGKVVFSRVGKVVSSRVGKAAPSSVGKAAPSSVGKAAPSSVGKAAPSSVGNVVSCRVGNASASSVDKAVSSDADSEEDDWPNFPASPPLRRSSAPSSPCSNDGDAEDGCSSSPSAVPSVSSGPSDSVLNMSSSEDEGVDWPTAPPSPPYVAAPSIFGSGNPVQLLHDNGGELCGAVASDSDCPPSPGAALPSAPLRGRVAAAAWDAEVRRRVRVLALAGSNIRQRNATGATLAHVAAKQGSARTLAALLRLGVSPSAKDLLGWTPLHEAARFSHAGCVRVLVASGARVDARNDTGDTPLHVAAAACAREATRALLAAGADRRAADLSGRTPLDVAHSLAVKRERLVGRLSGRFLSKKGFAHWTNWRHLLEKERKIRLVLNDIHGDW